MRHVSLNDAVNIETKTIKVLPSDLQKRSLDRLMTTSGLRKKRPEGTLFVISIRRMEFNSLSTSTSSAKKAEEIRD